MDADRTRLLRGALAGAVAAGVWAAQQPLDKKVFAVDYDDAELLGALFTGRRRTPASLALGGAMHLANGAMFGAMYAAIAPSLPGPGVARGVAAGMTEHLATWPLMRLVGAHPVGDEMPRLWGSHRAFAQATWRRVLFGALLGGLERRLNPPVGEAAAPSDELELARSNGHGNVEHLVTARAV
jgi:hypothetical protein